MARFVAAKKSPTRKRPTRPTYAGELRQLRGRVTELANKWGRSTVDALQDMEKTIREEDRRIYEAGAEAEERERRESRGACPECASLSPWRCGCSCPDCGELGEDCDCERCPECGGSEEGELRGCEACCRDCGRPCDFKKDGEGFHKD